jgi:Tol biopolymer transport system component
MSPHKTHAGSVALTGILALAAASIVSASGTPIGGTIAFSADNQIFVERGDKVRQLTHDNVGVVGIAWSPDGKRLLAWRYAETPAISIVNADGSIGRQLATDVAGEPRWSPTGKLIAFQRGQHGLGRNGRAIYVVNTQGKALRRVAGNALPGAVFGSVLSWSPDGNSIVYAGTSGTQHGLFTVRIGTGHSDSSVPLTSTRGSGPGTASDPVWSPDGSRIAYLDGSGISIVKTHGTALDHLPVKYVYGPVWSPDGSKLAFVGRHINYVVNADGSGLKTLPGCRCTNVWPGFGQRLSWSPDGSMIAYAGGTGPGRQPEAGIYVEKLDGSPPVRVARSSTRQYSRPLWRPHES